MPRWLYLTAWCGLGLITRLANGHGDHDIHDSSNSTETEATHSLTQVYLYGTLAVTVISVLSLAGVIVIPFIKQRLLYDSIMLAFMALSVGTMASDALLHLIPETIGLHGHSPSRDEVNNHTHAHDDQDDKPYLGKMVALLATIYGLYLLEIFAHGASKVAKKLAVVADSSAPKVVTMSEKNGAVVEMSDLPRKVSGQGRGHGHSHGHSDGVHAVVHGNICGMKPLAFVVVISDALHNFADGLAIGAGFAKGLPAGLAVSIAVICHELPHEVGDFAILLNTGMSFKKALLLNFLSALTCFAGFYPGVVAGQQESLRQWIFAAVAGGFLYVALVHMLRELQEYGQLPWILSVALQNLGLLLGFVIILLLAIYEDRLGGE